MVSLELQTSRRSRLRSSLGTFRLGSLGRLLFLPCVSGREEKHELFGIIFSQDRSPPHRNDEDCMTKPQHTLSLPSQGLRMQLHWDITAVPSPYLSPLVLIPDHHGLLGPCSASRGCFEVHYIPPQVLVSTSPQASAGGDTLLRATRRRNGTQGNSLLVTQLVSLVGDSVTHDVQCTVGMRRSGASLRLLYRMVIPMLPLCFQNSHRLRGLKSQSLQQIQKRPELLFHF